MLDKIGPSAQYIDTILGLIVDTIGMKHTLVENIIFFQAIEQLTTFHPPNGRVHLYTTFYT